MKSLKFKVMGSLLVVIAIVFTTISGVIIYNMLEMSTQQTEEYALSESRRFSEVIKSEMESVNTGIRALARAFEGSSKRKSLTPDQVNEMLIEYIEDNESIIGVWAVWQPNTLKDQIVISKSGGLTDDDGYFIPYWYRDGNTIKSDILIDFNVDGIGDWNLISRETKAETIMDPFYYEVGGEHVLMTTISVPIILDGKVLGAVGADISLTSLQEITSSVKMYDSGYGALISNAGYLTAHPNTDILARPISEFVDLMDIHDKIKAGETFTYDQTSKVTGKKSFYTHSPIFVGRTSTPWSFVTVVLEDEMKAEINRITVLSITAAFIGLIVVALIIWRIITGITKPIVATSVRIEEFSKYDFSKEACKDLSTGMKRNDEIGVMTNSLALMKQNIIDLIMEISQNANSVAASSEELSATSEQASYANTEIAKTVQDIAQGATEQAHDTESGVDVSEKLSGFIENEQKMVDSLETLTEHVEVLKSEGLVIMEDLIDKTRLASTSTGTVKQAIITTNESAGKIESASQMIRNIADQTNLLALNAAIEAARAGEAGKGFAVVADEIRKLAEESNRFTEEISKIITELSEKTNHAVETMDEVSEIVNNQTQSVENTSDKFNGIADSIENMKKGLEDIINAGKGMNESKDNILSIMQNLAALSEENAASTEEATASIEEQDASMQEIAGASTDLAVLAEEMLKNVSKFKY